MRKIFALLVVAMLLMGGVTIASVASVGGVGRHQYGDGHGYRLGAIFEEPKKDKVVDHVFPENGSPDVRSQKGDIENKISSVDNSYYLPPVGDQGQQGSCVAWSIGYYHKGYEENKEHGWTGSEKYDPAHQLSPAFVYNHVNGGVDEGSFFSEAARVICDSGIATMEDMPYTDSDYTRWPDTRTYFDALQYRAQDYHWIYVGDNYGIDNLKQHLANGHTAVLGINVWNNFYNIDDYDNIYTVYDKTEYNHGGHGVCVVGYDDNKETKDGKGAFKLVNSWGTSWGDNGFWWMSYEAVKDDDLSQKWVIYLDDKTDYHPKTVAELKINHQHRGDIMKKGITVAVGEETNTQWSYTFLKFDGIRSYVGDSDYQKHPFPDNSIVLDITDGFSSISSGGEDFYCALNDTISGTLGKATHFEVHYLPEKSSWFSSEAPKNIPDNSSEDTYLHLHLNAGGGFHSPIRIDSDRDFYELRGVFEGNGSEYDPYIIEGYDIDAQGQGNAIYVGNTTEYFVVRDCTFYNVSYHSWPYYHGDGITLYNVQNGKIYNNNASNNNCGIYLEHSNSNNITSNNASNNNYGIYLRYSYSNNITSNTASSNKYRGIYLRYSYSNNITSNTASNNDYGIYIYNSSSNNITSNNASNNNYGIYLYTYSNYNTVFHNSFINNTNQAYDDTGSNYWNVSYPTGGNYWSDYNGTDNYSGPGQNESRGDGIGDTPYTNIEGGSGAKDNYPLMPPWDSNDTTPPTFSGLKHIRNMGTGDALKLSWNSAKDTSMPIRYTIYRATTPGGEDFSHPIANTTSTYFIDTALKEGKTYYYVVRAQDSAGNMDNNTVELSGTPKIQWYFQRESSEIYGYNSMTNLTVYPLGNTSLISTHINTTGDHYLGAFMSEALDEDTNISGNWTFNAYLWISKKEIHSHPYAAVYSYSNNTTTLLFTAESQEDPASYTDENNMTPHLFTWTFNAPSKNLKKGDRVYVEIWENVTDIQYTYDTYSTKDGYAYYCDVDTYPPEGDSLNEKDPFTEEDYNSTSYSDDTYYHSPNPGKGDKVFMWFDTYLNESIDDINNITLSFEGHPSKDGTVYIYLYNWTSDKWESDELTCDDFTTADKVLTATISSGFSDYINSSTLRWGLYSEISNASLYVDYVFVNVSEYTSGSIFLAYDSESYDSSIIPSLGYKGLMMNITLHSGWDIITLPWQSTPTSIEDALSGISWDRAMVYMNNTWYTYNRSRDARYNLGFPAVDNSIGIWVYVDESGVLIGPDQDLGNTSIVLHKGWNLVGYASGHDQKVSDALSGIPWLHLETADANGNIYALSSSDYLLVGNAYWIYVSDDCVWTVGW